MGNRGTRRDHDGSKDSLSLGLKVRHANSGDRGSKDPPAKQDTPKSYGSNLKASANSCKSTGLVRYRDAPLSNACLIEPTVGSAVIMMTLTPGACAAICSSSDRPSRPPSLMSRSAISTRCSCKNVNASSALDAA